MKPGRRGRVVPAIAGRACAPAAPFATGRTYGRALDAGRLPPRRTRGGRLAESARAAGTRRSRAVAGALRVSNGSVAPLRRSGPSAGAPRASLRTGRGGDFGAYQVGAAVTSTRVGCDVSRPGQTIRTFAFVTRAGAGDGRGSTSARAGHRRPVVGSDCGYCFRKWLRLDNSWRRERDSNPRWGISPYSLSRGAPSAARPSLRSGPS